MRPTVTRTLVTIGLNEGLSIFGVKPLYKSVNTYCQLDEYGQTLIIYT